MNIFEELNKILFQENPFVCYVKPNRNKWNLIQQKNATLHEFLEQSGFVFAPFDDGIKVVIPFTESFIYSGFILSDENPISKNIQNTKYQNENFFIEIVRKGIEAIQLNVFDKVVLSRKIVIEEQIEIVKTFENLIHTYPSAFRYLFYHPQIGLWMGATPEQLVKINQNQFETTALAGTQLFSDVINWSKKEKEEQQFVTDFIVSSLVQKVSNLSVSNPITVQAGNLAHIKTIISGVLTSNFREIDLINTLHPTPAVCGFPRENAKDFILANENYRRSYYTGYLGEYNIDNRTDLFVNLRCLEVVEQQLDIYVGCGITKDSKPEKEFIETENKSLTMRNVLVFSNHI